MDISITSYRIKLPFIVFMLTFVLLAFVQGKVERPMLMAERFLEGSGWIEIFFIACYGGFVAWKMRDPDPDHNPPCIMYRTCRI